MLPVFLFPARCVGSYADCGGRFGGCSAHHTVSDGEAVMAGNAIACWSGTEDMTGHTIIRAWIVPSLCVLISHKDIAVGAATSLCLPSWLYFTQPSVDS